MGCHLRYFIVDKDNRRLGCLLFQQASRKLPCRDEWLGWQQVRYKEAFEAGGAKCTVLDLALGAGVEPGVEGIVAGGAAGGRRLADKMGRAASADGELR